MAFVSKRLFKCETHLDGIVKSKGVKPQGPLQTLNSLCVELKHGKLVQTMAFFFQHMKSLTFEFGLSRFDSVNIFSKFRVPFSSFLKNILLFYCLEHDC